MKQITLVIFLAITGCFIGLFAYTNQQTTLVKTNPTVSVQATCTLHTGRRVSVSCQPIVSTAECQHFAQQKCPIKKIKKIKNIKKITLSAEQLPLAQSLLATPQNAIVILQLPFRGKAKIKQIQIKDKILQVP